MNIILALIVISQILILPNLSFRWGKEASAQLLIILTLCSLIWQKNRALALFIGWSVVLFVIQKAYLINDAGGQTTYQVNLLAFFTMLNIVLYGIFYYVLHQIKFNKETIYNAFCLVAIIQSGYVLIQIANLDQFFFHLSGMYSGMKYSWPVGLWGNETLCSWCIALCSPYFLAFKKLRYKIGYGVCGVALFFTGGRIALAMYLLGFLFYLFFTKRRWLSTALLVLFLAGGIISYRVGLVERADPHRIEVWQHTIETWRVNKPMTGHGHGSFRLMIQKTLPARIQRDGHWAQAHNEYIQILFEQGIIGLGIFLSLFIITFYRFWKKRKGLIPIMSLFILAGIMTYGFPLRTAMGVIPLISLVLAEKEFK